MSSQRSNPDPTGDQPAWRERAAALPDPQQPAAIFPRDLLAEIFAHARECYPEECCGLVVGADAARPARAVRCTNVQTRRYSRGESQLDASHGFWIDEQELESALREADRAGEVLQAVYHSHIDTGAYLSHTDLAFATGPAGRPVWPGVGQLVVSVRNGEVCDVALFEWDGEKETYAGRPARESS